MNHSEQINEIAGALAKAQGEIRNAAKESENPFFHSRYADLASVWDACREPLAENGIAVVQSPEYVPDTNMVVLETMLTHSSGQWMASQLTGIPVKEVNETVDGQKVRKEVESRTPQAIGSCITYLRRYALAAFVGVAPEDDDANAASGKEGEAPAATNGETDLRSLKCPKCGKVGAIIKGKAEYGGGYVCWKKEGGCGKNFAVNDADLFPPKESKETPVAGPVEVPKKQEAEKPVRDSQTNSADKPTRTRAPRAAAAPAPPAVSATETKAEPEKKPESPRVVDRGALIAEIVNLTHVTQPQLAIKLDRLCGGDPQDAKEASAHIRNAKPLHLDSALESIVELARKYDGAGDKVRSVILGEIPEEKDDAKMHAELTVMAEELQKAFDEKVA